MRPSSTTRFDEWAAIRGAVRVMAGRLVSRMLQPASIKDLFATMDAISAEAANRGLTDEMFEAELTTYNAERREQSAPSDR